VVKIARQRSLCTIPPPTGLDPNTGDNQCLAGVNEIKNGLQLGTAGQGGAALLLLAHHRASGRLERDNLGRKILPGGRGAGIADFGGRCVHFGCACDGLRRFVFSTAKPSQNEHIFGAAAVQRECFPGVYP